MRKDAIKQARRAFAEDRGRIFLAMHVIFCVTKYAYKNGVAVLSKDKHFRDGQPHILDVMEKREHIAVPLKRYLAFGLECASAGTVMDEMEEILENRYYAGSYTGAEALIAYMYALGIRGMQEGCGCNCMLNRFRSLVPDEAEDDFEAFSLKLLDGYSEAGQMLRFRSKEELRLL